MNKGKILVTPRSLSEQGHPYLDRLRLAGYEVLMPFPGRQPSGEELHSVLPECIGYLAGVEKIDGQLLSSCKKLLVISRNGVGIDNIDVVAAKEANIAIEIAAGANARGVAELAIALMFSLVRQIPQTNSSIKAGKWNRMKGMELYGKTLGIFGTGQVGRQVASIASGIGMNILAYDLYPSSSLDKELSIKYVKEEQLLSGSDIITLHCPAGASPLIDNKAIGLMKTGTYLINTARSSLVDDTALLTAINSGKVAGYAADAFPSEPPELTELLLHEKVLVSAHIGGFTEESVNRGTEAAVMNLLRFLEGHTPGN